LVILPVVGIIENTLLDMGTKTIKSTNTPLELFTTFNKRPKKVNSFKHNISRNIHMSSHLKNIENNIPSNSDDNLDIQFKQWLINNKPEKTYLISAELKDKIYSENRKLCGIYLWYNNTNGKYYIVSAQDLTIRFTQCYSDKYLTNTFY
jgi:hypothetical protein